LLIPVERLFAGGGTSYFDPGVKRARPKAVALVHPDDAARLKVGEGDVITLENDRASQEYAVRLDASVIPGTVQVPKGLVEAPANSFGRGGALAVAAMKAVAEEVG